MEPKSKEKRSDGTLNCPAIETVSNGQMMGRQDALLKWLASIEDQFAYMCVCAVTIELQIMSHAWEMSLIDCKERRLFAK